MNLILATCDYAPLSCYYSTKLPYWNIYINEKRDKNIIVGGVLGGKIMAGLSGGQRKILLFELISKRTALQDNILIVLDGWCDGRLRLLHR